MSDQRLIGDRTEPTGKFAACRINLYIGVQRSLTQQGTVDIPQPAIVQFLGRAQAIDERNKILVTLCSELICLLCRHLPSPVRRRFRCQVGWPIHRWTGYTEAMDRPRWSAAD